MEAARKHLGDFFCLLNILIKLLIRFKLWRERDFNNKNFGFILNFMQVYFKFYELFFDIAR